MQTLYIEKQNLNRIYGEQVVPFLYSQENLRIKSLIKASVLYLVSFSIFVCNFLIIFFTINWITTNSIEVHKSTYFFLSIFLTIIFYISSFILHNADEIKQKYQKFIRKNCFDKIIDEISGFKTVVTDETSLDKDKYKQWEEVYCRTHTDLKEYFSQYSYEDIIDNEMYLYKSSRIKAYINKVTLTKLDNAKFIFFTRQVFNGMIISIDLPRKINNKYIITNNLYNSLLEDNEFVKIKKISKHLKLYAKNKFDFEFITTELISLIDNLIKSFRTKNVSILVSKNKVFITVKNDRGIFEISKLSKSYKNSETFKNFSNEIFALKQLFQYFESI